jgi:hypothetical protein
MGFNDRLGAEHYLIMVRHFSPMLLFRAEHIYDWILCAAQVVGAVLLLSPARNSTRLTRWYFFLQPVLFPLGVPTLVLAPSLIAGCFKGSMDREGFIDIPFVLAVTQPWWVLTSFAISILLRVPGWGFRECGAPPARRRGSAPARSSTLSAERLLRACWDCWLVHVRLLTLRKLAEPWYHFPHG